MQLPAKLKALSNQMHVTCLGLKHDLPQQVDVCQQAREEEERKHPKKIHHSAYHLTTSSSHMSGGGAD